MQNPPPGQRPAMRPAMRPAGFRPSVPRPRPTGMVRPQRPMVRPTARPVEGVRPVGAQIPTNPAGPGPMQPSAAQTPLETAIQQVDAPLADTTQPKQARRQYPTMPGYAGAQTPQPNGGFQAAQPRFQPPMQTGVQPVVQPQTGIASQNGASQGYPPQNGLQPAAVPSQPVQQQQGFQPVQPVQQQQGYQPIQQQQGFQPVQQQQGFQPVQQAVQGGFQPVQGVPQPQGYQPPATFNQQSGFQTPQPGLQQAQVVYQQPPTAAFGNMNIGGQLLAPNSVNLMAGPPQYENNRSVQPNINHLSATQSADANASPLYKRCTLNAIPQNATLLGKSKIPFGLLVTPYRQLQEGDPEIPVINSPQIVRCRRCRTYINPWVSFVEQGARWKCNVCTLTNEVPSFFDWDDKTRQRVDRMMRPELTHGVVEYVAPQEYMVRPPQPVVMMFLIDVSIGAVQSGMLAVACKAISESLSKIPDAENRAKVGFVTFDSALHYYNLSSALQEPQMLVVPDLEEPFLPLPYDLLVSLNESKDMVEMLLEKLPRMFQSNTTTLSCTGKALKSVEKMLSPIGGKIILLQQALPNMDEGQLKVREEPKMIGTPKETQLLQPAIPFYKNFAVDCSPNQISVDLFMFNAQYQDVATLNGLARFTGGNVYYYPGFNANRPEDAAKFASELKQHLTRPLGLEAVLRVRASSGIKMTSYHGNFFLRSTDLLALPSVNPDNCYCIEMQVVENLNNPTVCFQSALLHTSSNGERRIRVITLSVPVTTSMAEIYSSADPIAIAALLGKKAVERSLTSKLEDAREALFYKLVEILGQYKAAFNQGTHPAQLMIADNLQLLPLLIIGIIKNFAFKISSTTPTDHRSYALAMQYVYSPEMAVDSFVPRFYKLDTLITDPQIGMPDLENKIVFPPRLNLSSEKLDRENLFLLDNGSEIFIWIGRNVSPQIMTQLFGVETVAQLPAAKITLPRLENELSLRFNNLIQDIRTRRLKMMTLYPHLYVIRDEMDLNVRSWFLSHLIEDRTESALSYPQFLATVRDKMPKSK